MAGNYDVVEEALGEKTLDGPTAERIGQLLGVAGAPSPVAGLISAGGDLKSVQGSPDVIFVQPQGGQTFNFGNLPKAARSSVDVVVFDDGTPVKATFSKGFSGVVVLGDAVQGNAVKVDSSKSGGALVQGGSGSDSVRAGSGADTIVSGGGNDTIRSGDGSDVIVLSGSGNNRVDSGSGNDSVVTGSGNDSVVTGSGNDSVLTGIGSDTILTGTGSDVIKISGIDGESSAQISINGDAGSDRLDLADVAIEGVQKSGNVVTITLEDGRVIKAKSIESFTYDHDGDAGTAAITVGLKSLLDDFGP